ncbi:glycosyltransferase [Taibaiella lutea]|uniref:Glycosyltransferase n=1 Tax=Taibaiella lutea TaxID=2608001 RepID=A0A5M6CR52_9BACT|nr:glycosyltransferase [Taibaiella lutea]KAA5536860.1 glycosyltransferase [Taibaiella lutea]
MKIIIIGTAYPFKGGLASFNERLAYALLEQGHEVKIITFTLQYPGFLFPGKSQYSTEAAPKDLKIQQSLSSVNPLTWIKTAQILKREKADLILIKFWLPFMGPSFGKVLRGAKQNKHTKVISILDNVIPHEKRAGDAAFTKYFLKPVDAFISMSHQVMDDLRTFEKNKPALFSPHPVYDNYGDLMDKQVAREKLQIANEGRYILFFGYIRKYKGLDILLEAMADPRMKQENIKLIVAGEYYGDKDYYDEIINRLGIQDRLHLFTDFIPNEEVRNYFSAADVVVQPYRTATQSGISQIAYHFEKPMIVTNVGGLPEIVPDNKVGFVTDVDKNAIADAIIKFYKENKASDFSENIKEEKKRYSWHYFTDNILKLFKDI